MPFPSDDHHPRPRRYARSLDLDDSAAKAAAWVWHLHESKPGVTTEGRFLSSQSQRRRSSSSSSSDRRSSRFRQEAAEPTGAKAGRAKFETPMWDCGSNLYDTFELVAFGNRLDRSLMEAVIPAAPSRKTHSTSQELNAASLADQEGSGMHTCSLTRSAAQSRQEGSGMHTCSLTRSAAQSRQQTSKKDEGTVNTDRVSLLKSRELSFPVYAPDPAAKRWPSVGKLMKAFKKVVDLHKQVGMNGGCKNSVDTVASQRPLEPVSLSEDGNIEGSKARKVRSISHEGMYCSTHVLPPLQEKRINTRRISLDDVLLNASRRKGNHSAADGIDSAAKAMSKPMSQSHAYHKHLHHHHHHHHHHHYLHHTLASQSARLSPETLSKISADKSWNTT